MRGPYWSKWQAELDALHAIVAATELKEEQKWGQPCFTLDGTNVVILGAFKESAGLNFFQGALFEDPKHLLIQLGQVRAGRVMKFASVAEIAKHEKAIRGFLRQAIAAAKAGAKVDTTPREHPVPDELRAALRADAKLKRAFDALTPGRQRSWLFHFNGAKQAATRVSRIEKAKPAILAGRGFLERT